MISKTPIFNMQCSVQKLHANLFSYLPINLEIGMPVCELYYCELCLKTTNSSQCKGRLSTLQSVQTTLLAALWQTWWEVVAVYLFEVTVLFNYIDKLKGLYQY